MLYQNLIRPALFKQDVEKIHQRTIGLANLISKNYFLKKLIRKQFFYENKKLKQNILGIDFKNPIGLAAGFDKNAELIDFLPLLGFGFEEIGSITAQPCLGNPKPRLFRLPKEKSLIVNLGLPNKGADFIVQKLKKKIFEIPLGINIARTNVIMNKEGALTDFALGFKKLKDLGDYLTLNISCPNTFDEIDFCCPSVLNKLLSRIRKNKINKPVFLKIKPDLNSEWIDQIIKASKRYSFIKGFVIGNVTKDRYGLKMPKEEIDKVSLKGGLSGFPVKEKSNELIKYTYQKTKGKYTIIGCGGVFSAKDAYQKIRNGASLIQLITGMVYQGPFLIKKIKKDLVRILEKNHYQNIKEVIGEKAF